MNVFVAALLLVIGLGSPRAFGEIPEVVPSEKIVENEKAQKIKIPEIKPAENVSEQVASPVPKKISKNAAKITDDTDLETKEPYFEFMLGYSPTSVLDSSLMGVYTAQNSTDAVNLTLRYMRPLGGHFEYGFGLSYEAARTFNSYSTNGVTVPYLTPVPNLSFTYAQAQISYRIWRFILVGGVGYDYPMDYNFISELSSSYMWSAGLGFKASDVFTIEASYRFVDFSGMDRINNIANDYFRESGLLFRIGYAFK